MCLSHEGLKNYCSAIYTSVALVYKWSLAYLLIVSSSEMDGSRYFFAKVHLLKPSKLCHIWD